MRKFLTVFKYELKEYLTNKTFMVFTIILVLAGIIGPFLPRAFDMSDFTGVKVIDKADNDKIDEDEEKMKTFLYLDEAGIALEEVMNALAPDNHWKKVESRKEITTAVENKEAGAGFVITGMDTFEYYVYNKSMVDENQMLFEQIMKQFYRIHYCEENNLDVNEIMSMLDTPITVQEKILNKDTGNNFWYCYMLVISVFILIMLYGQMIAVAVTNEKSTRAIEVLVTTTSSNSLLFGKVIAGAIAGLIQAVAILGPVLISYNFNREVWGGQLDFLFNIPGEVMLTFATFGMGGYFFYAFLYGALGALVSKTEDISKSTGSLNLIIMVVYMFSLMQLTNVESVSIKVLSFLPFSSYSTMFARIAMGTVAPWEIVLSFAILAASVIVAGILGAKLYRMGTLRYGNPIRLSTALKDIKKNQ